jgi:hypothetical protein
LLAVACRSEPPPSKPAAPSAAPLPSAAVARPVPLRVERRAVEGRPYRLFEPVTASFALTLKRPTERDASVVLCVAGTYTSPENDVEGIVFLDGKRVRDRAQKWEGMLSIEDGRARVEHRAPSTFDAAAFERYGRRKTSLVQGHLLVDAGRPTKLKESPELYRRGIVTVDSGRSFVVESAEPVKLARFATDLAALGATAALNLDMGAWDEGWYRDESGAVVQLGHDRSHTERQSNWLVLRRSP